MIEFIILLFRFVSMYVLCVVDQNKSKVNYCRDSSYSSFKFTNWKIGPQHIGHEVHICAPHFCPARTYLVRATLLLSPDWRHCL